MKYLTRAMAALIMTGFFCGVHSPLFAEEPAPNAGTGLSAGIDYYSTYIWRGTYYFSGDGAFCPAVSYALPGTGLKASVVGEIASSYLFDGRKSEQKSYITWNYYRTLSYTIVRNGRKMNAAAYAQQGVDYGLEYSYSVANKVTLGASGWYWMYFNSGKSRETQKKNNSSFTGTVSAVFDFVPLLTPSLALSSDYYTLLKRGGDYYAQLGLKHDFELTKENKLTLGANAGYYYQNTAKFTQYYYASDYSAFLARKWPVKKGVSDVTPYVNMAYSKGAVSINSGFYWCIVPARTWHKDSDVHRFYAKLGASISI